MEGLGSVLSLQLSSKHPDLDMTLDRSCPTAVETAGGISDHPNFTDLLWAKNAFLNMTTVAHAIYENPCCCS